MPIREDLNESDSDYDDDDAEFDAHLQADPIENNEELEAMKRLLNEIKSPIRLVDMMRPSTIFEEPSINSNDTSSPTNSYVTAPDHMSATTNDPNISVDSLMIDGWSVHSSEHIDRSIDANSLADSGCVQSPAKADRLKLAAYRDYSVQPAKEQFNETLEEMEYVKDNSKYLLKPVHKGDTPGRQILASPSPRTKSSGTPAIVVDSPESAPIENVILIDSSPETSFETAQFSNYRRYVDSGDQRATAIKREQLCESIIISDDEDAVGEYVATKR